VIAPYRVDTAIAQGADEQQARATQPGASPHDVVRSAVAPSTATAHKCENFGVLIQIYGLTTPNDAHDVDRLGPDLIGVVLDEGFDTWDSVDVDTVREITAQITQARTVSLSLSTDPQRILSTARTVGADVVHVVHAIDIDEGTLDGIRNLVAPAQLMLTVPVSGDESVGTALRLANSADYLLLDTVHPDSGVIGASGLSHDWAVSADIVQAVEIPVLLAGGLGPHNVSEAITMVHPAGVDSETRTSHDHDRRRKDLSKVEQFIALARTNSSLG
jgi:phosphoribosylanthranilate isomerase